MSKTAAHPPLNTAQGSIGHHGTASELPAGKSRCGLVVHVAGPMQSATLEVVLRSSRNAVEAFGPKVPIEAVIQGPSVALLAAASESGGAVTEAVSEGSASSRAATA